MITGSVLRRTAAGGTFALLAVVGGSAVAAADGAASSPVYQGCLSQLRILYNVQADPASAPKCARGDAAISWNQAGPSGPAGQPGAQGAAGPKGDKGDPGAAGSAGQSAYQAWLDQGNTGTQADFLASLKGDKGDTGPAGPQGERGPAGGLGTTSLVVGTATSAQTDAGGQSVCVSHDAFGACTGWTTTSPAYGQMVTAVATCPAGTVPLSGTASFQGFGGHRPAVTESRLATASGGVPTTAADATSWTATMTDSAVPDQAWSVILRLLCLGAS